MVLPTFRPIGPCASPESTLTVVRMQRSTLSSTLRLSLPRLLALRTSFTAQEVLSRLRLEVGDPRTEAVHTAAARTSIWAGLLSDKVARDLGRAANRLPTVVFWYCQGLTPHELGRRLSPFGGAWDAERALGVAALLIAELLNRPEIVEIAA